MPAACFGISTESR